MAGQYIEPVFASSSVLPSFSPGALPSLCGICRGWGRSQLCVPCRERFAPRLARCQRCALRVPEGQPLCGACLHTPPPFDSAVAAFDYAHPWDALITRFKFQAAVELAPALAQCMVRAVEQHVPERLTLLLPVPLSQARQRERGYNQSWELARRVGRRLGIRSEAHLLLRLRDTPHQLALPIEQRAGNVHAAFAVEPRRRAELAGVDVAVIDDVMTTGATAAELAGVLRQAGAARVHIWVLARTPRPGPSLGP